MFTMASYDRAVKAAALLPAPAPIVETPKIAKVKAIDFYMAILGKYADVADARQIDHARYIASDDSLSGVEITPIGPSFAELDERLAALATVTTPAPVSTVVEIKGATYSVETIAPGEDNRQAVRLVKDDGTTYDVARTNFGTVECDCPDYIFKHEGTAGLCKHGLALVAAGLLDAPTVKAPAPVAHVPDEFDPPAAFVAEVASAVGPVADLGPDHPVGLAEYLASFGPESPSVVGPEGWYERVSREIDEALAALKGVISSHTLAPCCPADSEPLPCMGCVEAESFADELLEAVGPDPLDAMPCPTCGGEGNCPDCDPLDQATTIRADMDRAFGAVTCEGLTPAMLAVDEIPPGRYTLAQLVRAAGESFARWDSAPGDLIRHTLATLADRIVATGAATIHDFERIDALDRMASREALEADAFNDGFRDGEEQATRAFA